MSVRRTGGILNQEAGDIFLWGLVSFKEVNGQKLAARRVNLDVSCDQREDQYCSNKHQEQGQAAREEQKNNYTIPQKLLLKYSDAKR